MSSDNVVMLYRDFYAACVCGHKDFKLRCNGSGERWNQIIGTECNHCGLSVDWIKVNLVDESEINNHQ